MKLNKEPIAWKPEYTVNVKAMDDHHKKFLEVLNRLKEAIINNTVKENSSEIFYSLVYYADDALIKEGILFKDLNYPNTESHITKHKEFLDKIIQFQRDVEKGKEEEYLSLYSYLENWFNEHILEYDKEAVEFLKANGLG